MIGNGEVNHLSTNKQRYEYTNNDSCCHSGST